MINDHIWEGKPKENRVWFRDDCKNLVDQIYYTPIDYWIDVQSGGKQMNFYFRINFFSRFST